MKVTAFKSFLHGELGGFDKGKPKDVPDDEAVRLISMGFVEESKGKAAPDHEKADAEPAKSKPKSSKKPKE